MRSNIMKLTCAMALAFAIAALPMQVHAAAFTDEVTPANAAVTYYKFEKTGETTLYSDGTSLKVSPDTLDSGTITATYTKTVSASFSSSLASSQQNLIAASISGSFGYSLTTSIGITLDKRYGRGYMAFQPYKIKVSGNLKYYSSQYPTTPISSSAVYAKYPKKTDFGSFDGLYYIVYY